MVPETVLLEPVFNKVWQCSQIRLWRHLSGWSTNLNRSTRTSKWHQFEFDCWERGAQCSLDYPKQNFTFSISLAWKLDYLRGCFIGRGIYLNLILFDEFAMVAIYSQTFLEYCEGAHSSCSLRKTIHPTFLYLLWDKIKKIQILSYPCPLLIYSKLSPIFHSFSPNIKIIWCNVCLRGQKQ